MKIHWICCIDYAQSRTRLQKVLKQCKAVDLKLNKQKCVFIQSEIEYVGHTFSADCTKPSGKPHSVTELSPPEDKKITAKIFMYGQLFRKEYSKLTATLTHPHRELLEKSVEWHWTECHQLTLDHLNVMSTTEAPVLRYYNVDDDIIITVDSSSYGMGACLNKKGSR